MSRIISLAVTTLSLPAYAQDGSLKSGTYLTTDVLPPAFAAICQRMGGRMLTPDKARTIISGTVTDANGSRPAIITLQTPGYLRYEETGTSRVLTFNGNQFQGKGGQFSDDDERVIESFLSHFPDSVLLQLATGGTLRPIGGHFRTDDGTNPNYTGPYWIMFIFKPTSRNGLTRGRALQQDLFIAIDEKSWLPSEIRVIDNQGTRQQKVTQTQLLGWFQQAGQWYPGSIIRLENRQQVLRFDVLQAATTAQAPPSIFEP